MAWYKEKNVQTVIKDKLERKNFKVTADSGNSSHGVDLKAYHPKYRYYWIIEVKGYPEGYSEAALRQNYFWQVLGQILGRMTQENACYGICLPEHDFYRKKILNDNLRIARQRLYLTFFLVRKNKEILKLSPSGKKFIKF